MVAVWVLVHPGYPVTTTTETYYSRTCYLPTFWVRCDEFQATSSLDRLLPILLLSAPKTRGQCTAGTWGKQCLIQNASCCHKFVGSCRPSVHECWICLKFTPNSLVHFCSALFGPENHLSSNSSFFFFYPFYPFFSGVYFLANF